MTKIQPSLKAASDAKAEGFTRGVSTFMVDPRIIVVEEGFNARPIDPEHVEYMAALKRAGVDTGFLTLQMVDGKPTLRDGHHRHAADMKLIAEGVDILKVKAVEFKGDEKKAIFLMLSTQSGKLYTPLQVGEQYTKLMNTFGMSYAEIALERGMSVQHVKDSIRLTEQPAELKEMIKSGEVKAATALKLIKKEGATAAVATMREAQVKAPGKPLTQKAIDNLAKNVVPEAIKRGQVAGEHLAAMLDSPNFDGPTKAALRDAVALVTGKVHRIPPPKVDTKLTVMAWLERQTTHEHMGVRVAANLLTLALNGGALPSESSLSAQHYGHMVWLQEMAERSMDHQFRAAAHWFMAVLSSKRTKQEIAPAPSVMTLADALQAEKDSGGAVLAETLCPEQTELIAWVRGRA